MVVFVAAGCQGGVEDIDKEYDYERAGIDARCGEGVDIVPAEHHFEDIGVDDDAIGIGEGLSAPAFIHGREMDVFEDVGFFGLEETYEDDLILKVGGEVFVTYGV